MIISFGSLKNVETMQARIVALVAEELDKLMPGAVIRVGDTRSVKILANDHFVQMRLDENVITIIGTTGPTEKNLYNRKYNIMDPSGIDRLVSEVFEALGPCQAK